MLWRIACPALRGRSIFSVGVQLGEVELLQERDGDLLTGLRPAERTTGERAASPTNARFRAGTITDGVNRPHSGFLWRG